MADQNSNQNGMLFAQLVMSLNEAALIQLGKLVNPGTGKAEANLLQAQSTIDLLRMLQEKTRGNLNEQEQRLMDQSIMNLQMNFVYEQNLANSAAGGKEASETGENPETKSPEAGDDFPPGNRPGQNN